MTKTYIRPFRALIFNSSKIPDPSVCISPPYDVVTGVRKYYEKSKFNIIRLELPVSRPSMNKYTHALNVLEEWLRDEIIKRDDAETIYVYEQKFKIDGKDHLRRGFIPLLRLDRSRILVHEETKKKAKLDRKMLLSTTKTYTSLIFALYEDKENKIEDLLVQSRKEEIFSFIDEDLMENRLFKMKDEKEMAKLAKLMEEKKVYIADGHHRLDVSYGLGLDFIPIYLTNLYAPGLIILPYHRLLKFSKGLDFLRLLEREKGLMDIEKHKFDGYEVFENLKTKIKTSSGPSFILYAKKDPSNLYVMTVKDGALLDDNLPHPLRKLKVTILHRGIFKRVGVEEREIYFFHDEQKALSLVKDGEFDIAIFVPPTKVEEVKEIADHRLFMPPKSTFFYPKIPAGILLYKYA